MHTAADSRLQTLLCVAVLGLALAFGGGQGGPGDALTQLAALALIGALLLRQPDPRRWPKAGWLALPPLLVLGLFLLPWPAALDQAGSQRGQLAQAVQPVIGDGLQAGALLPLAAERALFWLLPAMALYWAVLQGSARLKRTLALWALAWIFLGAVIGLAQKAAGADSLLYFYSNTNRGSAVGLFANNNHYALAMAASLPLVWAGLVWLFNRRQERRVNPLWYPALSGIAIVFILGFMLSGSRAGLLLGMLGCLLMLPAVIAADRQQGARHWLFATMAIGLFLAVQFGLYFLSRQFGGEMLDDIRFPIAAITRQAADGFAPAGTGPGGFWFVFPQFDSRFLTGHVIVNHAHNDYLELWLELRWLAVLAGLPLLLAFLWQGGRLWLRAGDWQPDAILLARAAWIGLLLMMLHSFVDYPLRTTALLALAGLLAALAHLPPEEKVKQHPPGGQA